MEILFYILCFVGGAVLSLAAYVLIRNSLLKGKSDKIIE